VAYFSFFSAVQIMKLEANSPEMFLAVAKEVSANDILIFDKSTIQPAEALITPFIYYFNLNTFPFRTALEKHEVLLSVVRYLQGQDRRVFMLCGKDYVPDSFVKRTKLVYKEGLFISNGRGGPPRPGILTKALLPYKYTQFGDEVYLYEL